MHRPNVRACRAATATLLAAWLGACSGITLYPNTLEKNLRVSRDTQSGVRADVDVYRVDAQCRVDYRGTVRLEAPVTKIGLPLDAPTLLVFTFTSSSFLGGDRRSISKEALLRPRPGYAYEARARYRDDIYHVALHERAPGDRAPRELELTGLGGCRASKPAR